MASNEENKQDGKVNLNKASREELDQVRGLGKQSVDQILEYREKNGPFKSVDDLKNTQIFSENEVEKVRNHFTV